MKKVLLVLAVAVVAGTSCKKDTIAKESYENAPILNANTGDKIYFQVIAVETSGNELKTREAWVDFK